MLKSDPNPTHRAPPEIETCSSIPHSNPDPLYNESSDFRTPKRTPSDENEINTESDGRSAEEKPLTLKKGAINLNQKKEDNDYNTKTSTIKKIKNFFQRLCCVFIKTHAPIESLAPSIEVSSLGASPPNSIVESSPPNSILESSPPNSIVESSPPNSIVESPRGVSPAPIESPRGEYPGLSPVPKLCLSASSPRNNSSDSLSVFEKIEMFDYLVNAVDINFDKLIDDENKVNCYEVLLNEVNDEKADKFIKIYTKKGNWNSVLNSIVESKKINEKQGSNDDKIKIKLFNLINEKLKFDEDDLTDDKRIDRANFFIKGLIFKKDYIINKINKAAGDKSVGR